MIPVGINVRMSLEGKAVFEDSTDNPHNLIGVVLENERKVHEGAYCLDCLVEWSNGYKNTYDYEHLEIFVDFSEKELEDYL